MIGEDELRFLLTHEGAAALEIARAFPSEVPLHTRIERLRRELREPLASSAIEMVELRQRAAGKFSKAGRMLFTREALEQSSGEIPARHKAARFSRAGSVTDLCCGIGGDTLALAAGATVTALDRNPAHLECCRHNTVVYNVDQACIFEEADAASYAVRSAFAFIDPSRRDRGQRVRSGEEYSPSLSTVFALAGRIEGIAVKVAPGLDLPLLDPSWEMELISLDGVCREMVIWSGSLAACARRASVLRRRTPHSFEYETNSLASGRSSEDPAPKLGRLPLPGEWLLEPDPAIIRARLLELLAGQLGAAVVDPQIAYLITREAVSTPFAATYRILDSFPYHERRLREWLAVRRVGRLIVKKRGFPLLPEEVIRRMKLRGDQEATVVLTRQGDDHIAVIVE